MRELRQREVWKGNLYSIPALVILAIIALLLARGAMAIMDKSHESAAKLNELETENAMLKERQATLQGNLAKLETDEGIMEAIRNKFNAVRVGEHLAVIVEGRTLTASTSSGVVERLKRGWSWLLGLWSF